MARDVDDGLITRPSGRLLGEQDAEVVDARITLRHSGTRVDEGGDPSVRVEQAGAPLPHRVVRPQL